MSTDNITELRTEEYGGASFLMNSKFCGDGDDLDGMTTTPTRFGELPSKMSRHVHSDLPLRKPEVKSD